MARFTEREKEEAANGGGAMDLRGLGGFSFGGDEDEAEQERVEKAQTWEGLDDPMFTTSRRSPTTPFSTTCGPPIRRRRGPVRPRTAPQTTPKKTASPTPTSSLDGSAEHTVVRIITPDDEEDGWSIEVAPLTGAVSVHGDIVNPQDSLSWLPEEAPDLR